MFPPDNTFFTILFAVIAGGGFTIIWSDRRAKRRAEATRKRLERLMQKARPDERYTLNRADKIWKELEERDSVARVRIHE